MIRQKTSYYSHRDVKVKKNQENMGESIHVKFLNSPKVFVKK